MCKGEREPGVFEEIKDQDGGTQKSRESEDKMERQSGATRRLCMPWGGIQT